ncbi:MAG: cytidine deaminase [Bacteroidia bacterium]|nr:cytidine deaminase [Bacteroidia bacterium]
MRKVDLTLSYVVYGSVNELSKEDQDLIQLAVQASNKAYAPYSRFYVGCAILLENGKKVIGNNQENVAYPSGICAERVAIFAASAQYPGVAVKTMAITAHSIIMDPDTPITPCGACRQVVAEYESQFKKPIRILLLNPNGEVMEADSIDVFLPFMFRAEGLKK